MCDLRLTQPEKDMLLKILESYLSDLRVEITHTDLKDYRETLKAEETFIKELLRRLENTSAPVTV